MKKILVLGAGLVAKPLVEYLLDNDFFVEIACNTCDNAERIIDGHKNGSIAFWEATNMTELEKLTRGSDLVVSLLPYRFHVDIAKVCLICQKPLVTTSYVRDEMMKLDEEARQKDIILLNEIGLDPGIDHMSAMRIIDHVHEKGGKIEEFYSLCGALPSPESSDNPMNYKFSWSPKGVILASKNDALYLKKGQEVKVEPVDLFKDTFLHKVEGLGELEVYPNRNSVSYLDIYGIQEAKTIFRGTFRFKGWCETLDAMKSLNMLDETVSDYTGISYTGFLSGLLPHGSGSIKSRMSDFLGVPEDSVAIESFEWLGFFSDKDMAYSNSSPFEICSDIMISKMILKDHEKDMIVLKHLFKAVYPDGKSEIISSQMIDYGSPSTNTSVARTVGLPAAIAVKLILQGKINLNGVHRPVIPEIYEPILNELESLNIRMVEDFGLSESQMIG